MKLSYLKPETDYFEFAETDIVSTSFIIIPPVTLPKENDTGLEDDDIYET